jgi:hypothetical protein
VVAMTQARVGSAVDTLAQSFFVLVTHVTPTTIMKIRKSSLNGPLVGRHHDILVTYERRGPEQRSCFSQQLALPSEELRCGKGCYRSTAISRDPRFQ